MAANMLDGIEVHLNTVYFENKEEIDGLADKVVYTGSIDAYFDYKLGTLEYRSVRLDTEVLDIPNFQENDIPKTVISREYSSEWKVGDDSYYPVNDEWNGKLYQEYKKLAENEEKVIFGGRLGEYKYYDMDAVIASALQLAKNELK